MTVLVRPSAAVGTSSRIAALVTGSQRLRRWWRYGVTSVVATAVSEATLLLLFGFHLLGASAAAVAASLSGTVPSYLMSRFWIWPEAERRRPARQAIGYWAVALVSLGLSSLATGAAAAIAPERGAARLAIVGLAYIATYGGLWVAKFAVYQRVLFRAPASAHVEALPPAPTDGVAPVAGAPAE